MLWVEFPELKNKYRWEGEERRTVCNQRLIYKETTTTKSHVQVTTES